MAIVKSPDYVTPTVKKKISLPGSVGGSASYTSTGPGWGGVTSVTPISAPPTNFASVPSSPGVPGGSSVPSMDVGPYMQELTSDPLYQSGLTSYQNTVAANRNSLTNSLRQAVIQGGWAPNQLSLGNVGGQNLSGDIDQATIDAAGSNQMSDRAQLQTQLNRSLAGIGSTLAGRGAARSGASNIMAANSQNQYDVAAHQAMQNLAAALSGNVSNWAQNDANALAGWNQTQGSIANRLAQIASAQAQAAYGNGVNLGTSQITSSDYGPSPQTINLVNSIKSQIAAKAVSANPSGATVARRRGVISIH